MNLSPKPYSKLVPTIMKDMGKAMSMAMPRLKRRADRKLVNLLVIKHEKTKNRSKWTGFLMDMYVQDIQQG